MYGHPIMAVIISSAIILINPALAFTDLYAAALVIGGMGGLEAGN